MVKELLPCPLCGSGWHWNCPAQPGEMVRALCNGVDCNCAVYGVDQQQVIERINRRVIPPATGVLLAHIRGDLAAWPGNVSVPVPAHLAEAAVAEHEPAKPEAK